MYDAPIEAPLDWIGAGWSAVVNSAVVLPSEHHATSS